MRQSYYPVILVGGGTGGHIFPLVAIGEMLDERKIKFCYIGSLHSREEKIISELNWPFKAIYSGKWRRGDFFGFLPRNIYETLLSLLGFFQSMIILIMCRSRLIISKGGYVSLPVCLAAVILRRKIIIHESDAVMGLSNRLISRFADVVLTAFRVEEFRGFDKRYRQVGIPLRKSLRVIAKSVLLSRKRPLIMVIGGIQGARSINNLVFNAIDDYLSFSDIVHICGETDYQELLEKYQNLNTEIKKHYKLFPFLGHQLGYYLRSSDLIISRASATLIAEAAMFKKALLLIPLPRSAGDHQLKNAQVLENEKAIYLLEEQLADSLTLCVIAKKLISDKKRLREMGENLNKYFHVKNSLEIFFELIKQYG